MKNFKPNGERARITILFSWLLIGVQALCFASSLMQFNLLQRMETDGVSDAAIAANDIRETLVTWLCFTVFTAWFVIFLRWYYRARVNLQTKLHYELSCGPGRAVGNFFIPILCLFRPYQEMKELHEDTRELFAADSMTPTTALKTEFLGWWWGLWIVSAFVSNIVARMIFRGGGETLESLSGLTVAEMVSTVLDIVLTIATVIVVRDYARVEPLLAEKPDAPAATDATE